MSRKKNKTNQPSKCQDTNDQKGRDIDLGRKHDKKSSSSNGNGGLVNLTRNYENEAKMDITQEVSTSGTRNAKVVSNGTRVDISKGEKKNIDRSSLSFSSNFREPNQSAGPKTNGHKNLTQQDDMEYMNSVDEDGHDITHKKMKVKKASPYAREFDFTDFAYTPHTLSMLVALVGLFLFVIRYYYYPQMSVVTSVKLGLVASVMSFITFGMMHLPDSLMMRPHPFVWRAVLAIGVLYLALLSFLIFQDVSTVRALLGYYDPSLLKPLPEVEYATNCEIFTPDSPYYVNHNVLDIFLLAHFIGYFCKTLILRDWRITTCISIGFEVIEVSLQHWMLNMRECWWDHIVLDILLCNAGGILAGMLALRFLQAKEYHWVELRHIQGYGKKMQRILGQLGPRSFVHFEWGVFHSPRRFLQIFALICLVFIIEVNCFTMKHILRISHKHHLVIGRLIIWGVVGTPAIREVYEYINTNSKTKRFGTTAWVALLSFLLESIWIAKMSIEGDYFREPTPSYVVIPLLAALLLFVLWFTTYFGFIPLKDRLHRRGFIYAYSNMLFYSCLMCLLAVFLMGLPDLQIGRAAFESFISPYERSIIWWRA